MADEAGQGTEESKEDLTVNLTESETATRVDLFSTTLQDVSSTKHIAITALMEVTCQDPTVSIRCFIRMMGAKAGKWQMFSSLTRSTVRHSSICFPIPTE